MRKWSVTQVVQQRHVSGDSQQAYPLPLIGDKTQRSEQAIETEATPHLLQQPGGDLEGTEGMLEATVASTWINPIGEPQLRDRSQALDRSTIEQREIFPFQTNQTMNRISDRFRQDQTDLPSRTSA
jgi:hypothetical protein